MIRKRAKSGFEMPFSWVFAIIVGSIILFLAIYGTSRYIGVAREEQYTKTAAEIRNYLNPIVTGIATSASPPPIRFTQETRTYFDCREISSQSPIFGRQTIAFSEKSRIGGDWGEPGGRISVYNKYIFADEVEEGKILYFGVMGFYMGFKVDDLVFVSSEDYCFVTPPNEVKKKVQGIFQNVNISNTVGDCEEDSVKVCFDFVDNRCNMTVFGTCNLEDCETKYDTGYINKGFDSNSFVGNLMYAAIFSSSDIYECNVKRLGMKMSELSYLYKEKIDLVQTRGCMSDIGANLDVIAQRSSNMQSSLDLERIYQEVVAMDEKNEDAVCPIYAGEEY